MISRRHFLTTTGALASASWVHSASAQTIPELARILIGFPPGGSTDVIARRLADKMKGQYASSVIVENKPGAGAQIAVTTLKNSAPDGLTLLVSPGAPFSVYPFTYKKLPYAVDEIQPVGMVATFPFAFAVGPAVPASVKTLRDYLDWVKRNSAQGNYGSPAAGSTPHLVGELLSKQGATQLTHVAYRGDAAGIQDLLGGQLSGYSTVLGSLLPHLKGDKIRLLAISGAHRSTFVSEVPTYKEQGFAIEFTEWFGLFAPAKVPPATLQKIGSVLQTSLGDAEFGKALADFGMTPKFSGPADLARQIKTDAELWGPIIKSLGFTADT